MDHQITNSLLNNRLNNATSLHYAAYRIKEHISHTVNIFLSFVLLQEKKEEVPRIQPNQPDTNYGYEFIMRV